MYVVGDVMRATADAAASPGHAAIALTNAAQVVNERLSAVSLYGNSALANGVSYTKMSMNGYTWCNMPRSALTLSVGERVRWHVASVGSGDSLHNYHWHGHTVEVRHRTT